MATFDFLQQDKKKKLFLEVTGDEVNFSIWKKDAHVTLSVAEGKNLLKILQAELLKSKENNAGKQSSQDLAGEISKKLLNKKIGGFIYEGKEKKR